MAFNYSNLNLATGGDDCLIIIWNSKDWKILSKLDLFQ
jgi:WD40 repeat protein